MQIAILDLTQLENNAELAQAIQAAGMEVFDFSWNEPLEKLLAASGYIVHADSRYNLPSDALCALLRAESARGKPILGLSEGAAFLVENGLVPGLPGDRVGLSLVENDTKLPPQGQEIELRLSVDYQYNAFTRLLTLEQRLKLPLLTTKNRFLVPPGLLAEVKAQGLDVFLYCDEDAGLGNIAALANKSGNVLAMVPRPEKSPEGTAIFLSLRAHLASGYVARLDPLYYWPRAR